MSEHPDTDALEEADFAKYSDNEDVPIGCYHRMADHAREMEASAKSAARMLGEAWGQLKEARKIATAYRDDEYFDTGDMVRLPWEDSEANVEMRHDFGAAKIVVVHRLVVLLD